MGTKVKLVITSTDGKELVIEGNHVIVLVENDSDEVTQFMHGSSRILVSLMAAAAKNIFTEVMQEDEQPKKGDVA
jgi:hypothetical protein